MGVTTSTRMTEMMEATGVKRILQIVSSHNFFWQIVVADNIFANFVPVIFLQIALKDNFFWQMVIMDHRFANIR